MYLHESLLVQPTRRNAGGWTASAHRVVMSQDKWIITLKKRKRFSFITINNKKKTQKGITVVIHLQMLDQLVI